MTTAAPIRAVLIDEEIDARHALVQLLGQVRNIQIVASGYSVTDGLRLVLRESAQLLIVGAGIPAAVLTCARAIRAARPTLKIIRVADHATTLDLFHDPSALDANLDFAEVEAWVGVAYGRA